MTWYPSGAAVLAATVLVPLAIGTARPDSATPAPAAVSTALELHATPGSDALRLVVAGEGNVARYRVREQLARIDFPTDAIGKTGAITGGITLADDGSVVKDESKFTVDLTTLKSDSERRDGFIQRRTLQTAQFPHAEFVPTKIEGLPSPLPTTGEMNLSVSGDLTVHGVTHPVTWNVTARAADEGFTGSAATAFTFADFGMEAPRVAVLLSVQDTIRLEYDFHLVPAR